MKKFLIFLSLIVFTALLWPLYTIAQIEELGSKGENLPLTDSNVAKYNLLLMSNRLGIPYDSNYNQEILLFGNEWIGVPYAYGACSKKGTDCSGFAQGLYRSVYGLNMVHSSAGMFGQCVPVKKDQLMHGDLLFFKINKKRISHVGVYLGSGYFIHASTQSGVIVSHLDEPYYKRTYYSGGRVKTNN